MILLCLLLRLLPSPTLICNLSLFLLVVAVSIPQPLKAQAGEKNTPWGPTHDGDQTDNGTRGICPKMVDVPLTALIPDTHFGRTWSSTPTLWFYVPYSSAQIEYGEFSLLDNHNRDVVAPMVFDLPNQPGFVSLTLPHNNDAEPLLRDGVNYAWAFQLYCQGGVPDPVYVRGVIQLNLPTEQHQAALTMPNSDPYQVYWDHGIWVDAVDALVQQRLQHASAPALEAIWLDLLQDGGLDVETLPTSPFVGEAVWVGEDTTNLLYD